MPSPSFRNVIIIIVIAFILFYLLFKLSTHKFNKAIGYASADDTTPFVDVSGRESIKDVQRNIEKIRKEALSNIQHFDPIRGDFFFTRITNDDKWEKIYLKWYSDSPSYAYKLFPETMAIIDRHPDIRLAMFSLLKPGTVITPHEGPFRGAIRVHVGIKTPNSPKCWLKVGGEDYYWKDNEIIGFDDTYTHSVENNSDEDRIILFLDVERNFKWDFAQKLNRKIMGRIVPITSRQNTNIGVDD